MTDAVAVLVMFGLAVAIIFAAGAALGPHEKEEAGLHVRRSGQAAVRRDASEAEPTVSSVPTVLEEPETGPSDPMT